MSFEETWSQAFGAIAPVGHVLRVEHADKWTRFHALPGSKRYADSKSERRTILRRANTLASEMFEGENAIWLCIWSSSGSAARHDIPWCFDRIIEKGNTCNEDWVGSFYAKQQCWVPESNDDLLTEIAEDRERAIFFEPVSQRVFAPYDGGFDMTWSTPEEARLAKQRHPDWLSNHPGEL